MSRQVKGKGLDSSCAMDEWVNGVRQFSMAVCLMP